MSAVKSYFRDSFSVTSIFIVTAIFSVTENSSRAEFDNRLFSFQQPLRFAALSTSPYTGGGFHTREFSVHYQLDFESIFNRRRRDLTPRSTENLYPRTLPASARYTLKPRSVPKSFFRGLSRKTSPPREALLYIIIILLYINIAFSLEMSGFVCYNIGCICVYIRNYLKGKAYAVSV